MRNMLKHADPGNRAYNFGAGPATLPTEVLDEIRDELRDYHGTGMSMLEIGHRTDIFKPVQEETESLLRELMAIPRDYAVLFLHGGATMQFGMVPLNLAGGRPVNYVVTGLWSTKALREGQRLGTVNVAADATASGFTTVPPLAEWRVDANAAYLHYTTNETIAGLEFPAPPALSGMPLVADMTSMILSRPVDVARHVLIYAGAQKNMGIAGITAVILDPKALRELPARTPNMLDYRAHIEAGSLLNTPPVFAWYVVGRVLAWLKRKGGVAVMAEDNRRKALALYKAIDTSGGFYVNRVDPVWRSSMNVPFNIQEAALEPLFVTESTASGLLSLAGHRTAGGMRASIYNAMPEAGIRTLIDFMQDFQRRHG